MNEGVYAALNYSSRLIRATLATTVNPESSPLNASSMLNVLEATGMDAMIRVAKMM